jgi:hypothetical protein
LGAGVHHGNLESLHYSRGSSTTKSFFKFASSPFGSTIALAQLSPYSSLGYTDAMPPKFENLRELQNLLNTSFLGRYLLIRVP